MATKNKKSNIEASGKPEETFDLPTRKNRSASRKIAYGLLVALGLFVLTTVALRAAYASRIYPGVWGHGVYLGGLTPNEASKLLDKETLAYSQNPILIEANGKTVSVPQKDISVTYNNETLSKELMRQGRDGNIAEQIISQWALLAGIASRDNTSLTYDDAALATTTIAINNELAKPSVNASYQVAEGKVGFTAGTAGKRLDYGALGLALHSALARLDEQIIPVQTDSVEPSVDSATLEANKALAQSYISSPLQLGYAGKTWQVDPATAFGWLHSTTSPEAKVYSQNLLEGYYGAATPAKELEFDAARIDSYLTEISKEIDQAAIDAQLNVTDNRATVFVASRDGKKLNVVRTRDAILASLNTTDAQRTIAMSVDTTKPTVNEESINNLGIKELLSEGISYFPGSSANRLTNVRVGAARYNGVLLKPGEVFSFGKLLGNVGPEEGYTPGWVILGDRQEEQYGGGLCQVSSTAFRAALTAGLPILERVNHAFAISYYTAPYGVPGVDATIYYPPVDFKFRNDTDAHLLIQTEMIGTTLKFRFYGTKKKEGVIRGPYFVSGSSDVNQPSQTVFYRDIKVNGQVTKTDTFNTYYQSALKFPKPDSQ
jgi:vancomycin resistance protein YoaR